MSLFAMAFCSMSVIFASCPQQADVHNSMLISRLSVDQVKIARADDLTVNVMIIATITMTNESELPIFLLNKEGFPHFDSGFILSKGPSPGHQDHLTSAFDGESVDNSTRWKDLGKMIDTRIPEREEFIILFPKDTHEIKKTLEFNLPLAKTQGSSSKSGASRDIEGSTKVWLQVLGSSWSDNIDRANCDLKTRLRERWKPFGCLWTNALRTEVIELNLNQFEPTSALK